MVTFQVNMQLHIHYSRKQVKFFTSFHQQFKCSNYEWQMPIAHSVFKQSVHDVSAHQLQQHTIKICYVTVGLRV